METTTEKMYSGLSPSIDREQTNSASANKTTSTCQSMKMIPEETGRPSLVDLDSNDFLFRESLGVLSDSMLFRDSLTRDQLNLQAKKQLGNEDISFRDSLGLLNLSTIDVGRESLQIFNVRESLIGSTDIKNLLYSNKPSVQVTVSKTSDNVEYPSLGVLNEAFLYSDSRKLSSASSLLSCNPSFSFRSFNEPSPILPLGSFENDIDSKLVISDPLNEAFKFSMNNKCSVSQVISHNTLVSDLDNNESFRKRFQSLPTAVTFEENLKNTIEDADDSVFLEGQKVAKDISNSFYIEDKSSDSSKYNLLDSIPEPNWPNDLDRSQSGSEKKIKYDKETVAKKIDQMLDLKPTNLDEKLNDNNCSNDNNMLQIPDLPKLPEDKSPANRSNISNNLSHNISKISQSSNESILKIIRNLSDFVKDKEGLSISRRSEYLHSLNSLASEISSTRSDQILSEDSGHSSVEEPHFKENRSSENRNDSNGCCTHSDLVHNKSDECHALDLSCRSKSGKENNKNVSNLRGISPGSVQKPPPYVSKTPKRNNLSSFNASAPSNDSHKRSTNDSNTSNKSGNISGRISNISQSKSAISGNIRKSTTGQVASKKGPMRAVLPLENMAKGSKSNVTPERNENMKLMIRSNRTSTPIHEVSLKPTLTSTPANVNVKDKAYVISPLSTKTKYYRSFSERLSSSASYKKPEKLKESTTNASKSLLKSVNKVEVSKIRRNSVSEGLTDNKNDKTEGSMRIKRSFSTGKEPKIMSALSKVRQNILSSPYYHTKGGTPKQSSVLTEHNKKSNPEVKGNESKLATFSASKKLGKENIKH
ncbi:uncharacterized protein LOC115888564 isoform X2 [Sitophilus oryzae]|uniref:Uncharacterized protein LOC115888564 isoform X2 n=1 Tax=Sitophilus oryzae TaxID=7048 RepID=A0A6J2YLA6_SITOR|nr:uncharacterized protein LOC115888564 isoform X2 [Sitophilus oryzae]